MLLPALIEGALLLFDICRLRFTSCLGIGRSGHLGGVCMVTGDGVVVRTVAVPDDNGVTALPLVSIGSDTSSL